MAFVEHANVTMINQHGFIDAEIEGNPPKRVRYCFTTEVYASSYMIQRTKELKRLCIKHRLEGIGSDVIEWW